MENQPPVQEMTNEVNPEEVDSEVQITPPNMNQTPKRRRKAFIWDFFTKVEVEEGVTRARCNHCQASYAYKTKGKCSGTSNPRRHLELECPGRELQEISGPSHSLPKDDHQIARMITTQEISGPSHSMPKDDLQIARMIITRDYPLHLITDSDFFAFVRSLQPSLEALSFDALQSDILEIYHSEKQGIRKAIEGMRDRVSLMLDLWSSPICSMGYVFVRGQFLDEDWNLHRKLLNIIKEPFPGSDVALSRSIEACLADWVILGKLFSVTTNQQPSEASVDNLRARLSFDKSSVLQGQLLGKSCLARSVSAIVTAAYNSVSPLIERVRDMVKYVKTSDSHNEKFLKLKDRLQMQSSMSLSFDNSIQWNTTYQMLVAAFELRQVYSCLDIEIPDFKTALSPKDWEHIKILCALVKPFFDIASLLTSETPMTADVFFHQACNIQMELARESSKVEDEFMGLLGKSMHENFNGYWKSCCYVLSAAAMMDPRYKKRIFEYDFSRMNGDSASADEHIKAVDVGIRKLFEEYMMEKTGRPAKSEVDQYLEEPLLPRDHDLDVMGWWKMNQTAYPTLSKMARDLLTVPMSVAPAGSVFDTAVRKEMDTDRSSLPPETLQAWMCLRDWLMQ